ACSYRRRGSSPLEPIPSTRRTRLCPFRGWSADARIYDHTPSRQRRVGSERRVMTTLALVGPPDRQLEALVRSYVRQVTPLDAVHLAERAGRAGRHFHAIVVDLRTATSIPGAISAIRRNHPTVGVIIITAALDPAFLVEAMRAGVNEVVTDPIDEAELERALVRVAEQRPAGEIGDVFGFVGAKGGVGATTLAVNVAAVLGSVSKPGRTLLIDLH